MSGAKEHRLGIDDLYGSTWLSTGAGSVLLLTGSPGDPIVGCTTSNSRHPKSGR